MVVDICYLLHKYQLHVSALMAFFRLNELTKIQAVTFGMRLIYGGGGFYWVVYEISCELSREGVIWVLLC
jgi:hypothetical protein